MVALETTSTSTGWSKASMQATVDRWDLTREEEQKLWELETRLSDIHHPKNCPAEVVRFLLETHGSLKATEKMFRKFIQWRIDNGVDTLLEDYCPEPLLQDYFPMTMLDTYDKDGDGIWFQAFGVADVPGLLKRFGRKELAKYFLWVQERAAEGPWGQIYEKKMKRAPRVTVVIDLEGFNRGHAKPAAFVVYEDILCMIQNYYCMFVKKIIFVREPAIFRMIWPVAKNLFNANFQKLMVFAGSDFKSILGEYISDLEESLPPILLQNGRGKGGIGMPQRLDGGPLPKESSLLYKSIFQSKETPSSNSSSSSASCPPPRLVYSSSGSGCEDDENSSVSSYGSSIISSTTISKPVPILSEAMIPCTTTVTTTSVRSGSNVRCQRLMGGSFKILCD